MIHRTARNRASAVIAGLLTTAWLLPSLAQPAPPPVELTWQAPPECPSRDAALAEVARLLRSSHNPRLPAAATVRVEQEPGGPWRGALSLDARDAHSERVLEAESCDAVVAAAALVIAIAVEGGVPPQPVEPAVTSAAPRPEPPPPSRPAQAVATPAPFVASSQLSLSAGIAFDDGTMPTPTPGGAVDVGWSYTGRGFRLRALGGVTYFPTETVRSMAALNEGGSFWLLTGSVRACLSVVRGSFDVGPCLGGEVAGMSALGARGEATAIFEPHDKYGVWVSAVAALLGSWSPSPTFALYLRADVVLSPFLPSFVLDFPPPGGSALVWAPPGVAGRGVLGVEVRFF